MLTVNAKLINLSQGYSKLFPLTAIIVFVWFWPMFHLCSHCAMLSPPGQCAEDRWMLNYVSGDLFSCGEDEALAHCISEDCNMGKGIAVVFKKKFKGEEELREQSESKLSLIIHHK